MYTGAWAAIGAYCEAKCAADEFLYAESRRAAKPRWEDICLRPGALTDAPATGRVELGRSRAAGGVSRADVAAVAAELLERGGAGGLWLDMVAGQEEVGEAVARCVRDRVTARE